MQNKTLISCWFAANGSGLTFTAKLDDRVIWTGDPAGSHDLSIELDDDDGYHALTFEMSGKTADHTQLDQAGKIIKDLTVNIEGVKFDDIILGHTFIEKAVYEHDFNGTKDKVQDKFYGIMGCNGTITLKFTTPIYLWLLENM